MSFSLSKFLKRFLLLCKIMSPMSFHSKGSEYSGIFLKSSSLITGKLYNSLFLKLCSACLAAFLVQISPKEGGHSYIQLHALNEVYFVILFCHEIKYYVV
jgi:hypothetical protein